MSYLLIEYLPDDKAELSRINEDELFDLIQDEGDPKNLERRKIAIYEIKTCLIDWS